MSRILIIDDEPDVRLALSVTLEEAGHEVCEGASGQACYGLAVGVQPDLVLLDISMPGLDGFACLQMLKGDPRTARIPVVMVTALADPEDMRRARSLGAVDYVTKPWSATDLLERCCAAIAEARRPALC